MALVTRNAATRTAASAVGVPVFAQSTEDAANDRWHMDPLLPPIDPSHPDKDLPDPPPWRRQDVVERAARPTLFQARQERIRKGTRYRQPTPVWLRWAGNMLLGGLIVLALAAFTFYVLPAATISMRPGRLPLKTDVNMTAIVGLAAADLQTSSCRRAW